MCSWEGVTFSIKTQDGNYGLNILLPWFFHSEINWRTVIICVFLVHRVTTNIVDMMSRSWSSGHLPCILKTPQIHFMLEGSLDFFKKEPKCGDPSIFHFVIQLPVCKFKIQSPSRLQRCTTGSEFKGFECISDCLLTKAYWCPFSSETVVNGFCCM